MSKRGIPECISADAAYHFNLCAKSSGHNGLIRALAALADVKLACAQRLAGFRQAGGPECQIGVEGADDADARLGTGHA
jgi:hypothetical protein